MLILFIASHLPVYVVCVLCVYVCLCIRACVCVCVCVITCVEAQVRGWESSSLVHPPESLRQSLNQTHSQRLNYREAASLSSPSIWVAAPAGSWLAAQLPVGEDYLTRAAETRLRFSVPQ